RLILPGKQNLSIVMTLLLGLAGSIVGGLVANALGTGDLFELNFLGFIVAIIAAVVLVGIGAKASSAGGRSS
ncbi:MAG: GlsB/YeaQ/YmgE family stress response membrane protein, partial [Actinomycetota bacterium]|nr:GlsB/YeaQ/YmgE family stress response membrane protein [Actinomycetota bacterium]